VGAQRPTITVQLEEDWFAGLDQYYTTGERILATWNAKGAPSLIRSTGRILNWLWPLPEDTGGADAISAGLATQYYTPDSPSSSGLGPTDRPYAGWLFVDTRLTDQRVDSDRKILGEDRVELQIGIVGPHAFSGDIQTWFHKRILNVPAFVGWPNQLRDEPGLMLWGERSWRFPRADIARGLGFDVWPRLGGAIGNVRTQLHAGFDARLGFNLPEHMALGALPATVTANAAMGEPLSNEDRWSVYVSAGMEVRAIAHNIFLDGNSFVASHHVDKRIVVRDTYIGVAVQRGRFALSYQMIERGKEFFGQKAPQRYGVVTLSFGI